RRLDGRIVEEHAAGVGREETEEEPEERRLAAARRAEHGGGDAGADVEVDRPQPRGPVALGGAAQREGYWRTHTPCTGPKPAAIFPKFCTVTQAEPSTEYGISNLGTLPRFTWSSAVVAKRAMSAITCSGSSSSATVTRVVWLGAMVRIFKLSGDTSPNAAAMRKPAAAALTPLTVRISAP